MSSDREQRLQDLIGYLRTIQKPNKPIESVASTLNGSPRWPASLT